MLKGSPGLDDVPTVSESGIPGYEVNQWYGVVTSARVPRAILARLSAEVAASAKSPDVAQRFLTDGSVAVGSTSEEFTARVRAEIAKWRKLVKEAKLQLE